MAVALDYFKGRKWWLIGGSIILIILLGVMISYLIFHIQIKDYDLDGVERIEYIEYEGVPFSSSIKLKKALSLKEDASIMDRIKKELKLSNSTSGSIEQSSRMLFFYHRDGSILNAYVQEELLGFDYGSKWIRISGLDSIINNLEVVELIQVKEGNI